MFLTGGFLAITPSCTPLVFIDLGNFRLIANEWESDLLSGREESSSELFMNECMNETHEHTH